MKRIDDLNAWAKGKIVEKADCETGDSGVAVIVTFTDKSQLQLDIGKTNNDIPVIIPYDLKVEM
jgi:hypothetical protein